MSTPLEHDAFAAACGRYRVFPPGTYLPEPASPLEKRLLRDLLALPDESDPLEWMLHSRPAAVTRLVGHDLLLTLRERVSAAQEERRWGWRSNPSYEAWLAAFRDAILNYPVEQHDQADPPGLETIRATVIRFQI